MKELRHLTPAESGRKTHRHIVYLNDEAGMGLCSIDDNHTHQLEYTETGWIVHPAQDMHTHVVDILRQKKTKPDESNEEIVAEVVSLYRNALEVESKSIEKAHESEKFYCGEQWTAADKNRLHSLDRAALTINFTQKYIDDLSGFQRENRTDFHCVPKEDGDQRTSDLYNLSLKHISEECFFPREESVAFEDAIIAGRGHFNVFMDYSKDIEGRIKIERFPFDAVLYGPHEKLDASDAEYLVKHKMYSLAKLKQLYPKKAKDIQKTYDELRDYAPHTSVVGDQYRIGQDSWRPMTVNNQVMLDIANKEFKVIECWRRIYLNSSAAINSADGFIMNTINLTAKDINSIRTIAGFVVVEQLITKIRITKICSGVLLYDDYIADLPVDDFFIVPIYCYKRRNFFYGKVEAAKDAQIEMNKRHSQCVDILNKVATYNHFIDSNTFIDEVEERKFLETSSSPGATFKLNEVTRPPIKSEGVKFPSEIVNLLQLDKDQFHELMNINPETNPYQSEAALLQSQKMRMRGNQFLFDNLAFAKKQLGKLLIKLIQTHYSPERLYRIVSSTQNGRELGFSVQEIAYILSNQDVENYDIEVSESSYSPTTRLGTQLLLLEMVKAGQPIPPQILVSLADIPESEKKKIIEAVEQQQQMQATAAGDASATEINKTLIAQGYMPPQIKEQFLGQQAQQPAQPVPSEAQLANQSSLTQ